MGILSKEMRKPLTRRQWQAVLNGTLKSYNESYAMMVDDAMRGFKKHANKYGLGDYWDGLVFGFLFSRVRNFNGHLTDEDIETLNELKIEDAF